MLTWEASADNQLETTSAYRSINKAIGEQADDRDGKDKLVEEGELNKADEQIGGRYEGAEDKAMGRLVFRKRQEDTDGGAGQALITGAPRQV
jgi:hypothetical protein